MHKIGTDKISSFLRYTFENEASWEDYKFADEFIMEHYKASQEKYYQDQYSTDMKSGKVH
jgi:hypothetical protein